MRSTSFFAFILVAALTAPALAQTPPTSTPPANTPPAGPPVPVRGTVEKLDGQNLTVKSRDGQSVLVVLAPNFTVRAVAPKTIADIKPGDFVASTSIKRPDGTLQAIELHLLSANLRARIEGQTPTDLVPDGLMTNATVAQIVAAPQGQVMKVSYKGKEETINVPPGIPIVGYISGDAALLTPGAAVVITARKQPNGSLTAAFVTAERDGVKPPM
jgi:hypothetical protein